MNHNILAIDPELYLTTVGGYYLSEALKAHSLGSNCYHPHKIEDILEILEDSKTINGTKAVKWFNNCTEEQLITLDKNIQRYANNLYTTWLALTELEASKQTFLNMEAFK